MTRGSLTVLIGAPGSGKTTHAARRAELGEHVISSDTIRAEMFGGEEVSDSRPLVSEELYTRVRTALAAGQRVTVDATNTTRTERLWLLSLAVETGTEWTCAAVMQVPVGVCLERNAARDRRVPEYFIRECSARVWGALDHLDLFAEGFTHVQFIDRHGQNAGSYDHPYPAGEHNCADCKAIAQTA